MTSCATLSVLCGCGSETAPDIVPVAAEAEFELGGNGGQNPAFSEVMDVAVGPDGRVYVTDWLVPHVQVFDESGALVDSIGRDGDGPGELRGVGSLGFIGDTLWVETDRRVNLYSLAGEYLGGAAFRAINEDGRMTRRPIRYSGGGLYYAESRGLPEYLREGSVTTMQVLRTTPSGDVVDTVVGLDQPSSIVQLRDGDQWAAMYKLDELAPPNIAYFSGAAGLVAVERFTRAVDSFQVSWLDAGGRIASRTVLHKAQRPFPDSVKDAVANRIADGLSNESRPYASVRAIVMEQVSWPAHAPLYLGIAAGEDGRVWLHQYDSAGAANWDAVEPSGRTTRVVLPAGITVHEADSSHVWGSILDELDVPHLWRFRITGQPEE